MEVKPSYKQTEVGVIPEDWEVFQLSDHFRIYAGGDVPKHSVSNFRSDAHPYPIFANALQEQGLYGFTSERRAKANSLTITARGYLGHAEYRDEEFFPIVRLLVLEPSGALDARFTTYAVNERVKFAFESTGVPQLTAPQVGKYSVAAPSLPEQRAIAEALSDVDGLLSGLDRLIAKKRDLKQAAMQQLLTGQTRLPGFHGEWVLKELGSVCNQVTTGKLDANAMSLNGEYRFYTCAKDFYYIDKYAFDCEALLISGNGANVGYIHYYKGKFNAYQRTYVLSGFSASINYIQHYLSQKLAERIEVEVKAGGTPYITRSTITEMSINLPPSKAEQTAIAAVLSEMDQELAVLEQRREKTRALKQAMMQELLTGKTRLI
jgi:type I restriction enzyme S subunit